MFHVTELPYGVIQTSFGRREEVLAAGRSADEGHL